MFWTSFPFPRFEFFITKPEPGLVNLLKIPLKTEPRIGRLVYEIIDDFEQELLKIQGIFYSPVLIFLVSRIFTIKSCF
jgi:hypothetical protein